jgi:hypothetical protein
VRSPIAAILSDVVFRFGDFDLSLFGAADHGILRRQVRSSRPPKRHSVPPISLKLAGSSRTRSRYARPPRFAARSRRGASDGRSGDRLDERAPRKGAGIDDPDARTVLDQLER